MELPPLILASQSPRREQLLRQLEINFQVITAPVQESTSDQLTAQELSQINAYRKCWAVAKDHPDHLVIGADTLVCLGQRVFGKPQDHDEAYQMLDSLQGHTHSVVTGVCLIQRRHHQETLFSEVSQVTFKSLDTLNIRNYLSLIDPLDKAGGYALQEHQDLIIDHVEGSSSNVIGLPLERLFQELENWPDVVA